MSASRKALQRSLLSFETTTLIGVTLVTNSSRFCP